LYLLAPTSTGASSNTDGKKVLQIPRGTKDKVTSVEASQGPDIPTHLLMNRPVSIRCSAVDRNIQITETAVYLKALGNVGAGAGICSHASVDKNLIIFPVLCSTPATAGDLTSRER